MPAPVPSPMRRRLLPPLLSAYRTLPSAPASPRYRFHTALTAPSQPAPEKRSGRHSDAVHPSTVRKMPDHTESPTQPPPKAASVHNICDPACEKNLLLIKRQTMETPDPQMSGIPEPVCRSPQCGLPSSPGVLNI